VTRHFYFRDDCDAAQARILDDVTNLALGVEAAVPRAIPFGAPRANGRESRIAPDLHAPTLIFRQMPVKDVHLVPREDVDVFSDCFDREEMPTDIHETSSPRKSRRITNRDAGDAPCRAAFSFRVVEVRGQQQPECLHTPECAG
jgi:hypothetical protein